MKKLFSLAIIVLSCIVVQSQNRTCGTMQHLDEIRQNDPQVDLRMQVEESAIQNWIANNPENLMLNVITIPVVVHIIYKTSAQNLSDNDVYSQIQVLNEDFRKTNADASSVPSAFSGVAADSEIEFCLAVRDPNGNTTTGITRTYTSSSSFSTNDNMKHTSSGGKDAWSTSDYLNIWVCNISGGILGYAQFPNSGSANEDGIVIDYAYFGDISATYPYDKGRTATHEVGHWLNLRHIWGDATCGNDYVSDTPTQASSNGGCPSFPSTSNCTGNSPNGDMFMNYMDYTYDACMYMFSAGQKTRMRATLNGSRSSLLSSNGCVPVNIPIVLSATIAHISCNGGTDGAIDLSVSGGLAPFSYSWSTGATSQDISNLSAGSYTVNVTDAQGQVQTAAYSIAEPTAISIWYNAVNTSAQGMSDGAIYTATAGGAPPYAYYWVSPYATTQNLTNIPAGTYTFYAIDTNGCYSVENITVQDGIITPITASATITDVVCDGDTNGAIDVIVSSGVPPYSYTWSNGATAEDLSNLNGGNYTLTITDLQSQTYTATYTVNEPLPLSLSYTITNESATGTNDGAIDMVVIGGTTPYLYYWNTNPSQSTEDISGLSAGDYIVYVGYSNWSCFISDTITVPIGNIISGCTNPTATNYNATATVDDGSCVYICNEDAPTNLSATNVIHDRATINWDNMNSTSCMVDQYRIKYRAVGTSAWTSKTMGAPVGSCNFGTNKTDKLLLNLTPATTYEYQMKAWYCGGSPSAWTALQNFTTLINCPNINNLQVSTPTTSKATFTWNATAAYSFVRIKSRIDVTGSAWFNVGGFGVNYPALTKNKNGLTPGTSYRAQARTWCDPNGGAYRSALWTSPIFWTQPSVIRLANANITERTLLRITDLLGREVSPDAVIDKTTLLYIYDDGTVEKRVIIE